MNYYNKLSKQNLNFFNETGIKYEFLNAKNI